MRGRVRDFRVAAVVGGLIPIPLSLATTGGLELSRSVGLAFAVAASTLCPLLVLGIWWRGLTAWGAACGLVVGGVLSGTAVTVAVAGGIDDDVLGGWPAVLIGYPAAVTVPLAFATMIAGQPPDPSRRCRRTSRRSSPACTCRNGWAWASSGVPRRADHVVDRSSSPIDRSPHRPRASPCHLPYALGM